MNTTRVIINNLDIHYHYADLEADTVVVFLHGWGLSARSFAPVIAHVQNAPNFKGGAVGILALDFPGFGDSGALTQPFTLDDYAAVTREFLRKKAKGKNIILVGHSFGGRVIVKMLAQDNTENMEDMNISQIIFVGVPFFREMSVKVKALSSVASIANKLLCVPPLSWVQNSIRRIGYKVFGVEDYAGLRSITMRDTFRNVVSDEINVILPQFAQNYQAVPMHMIWGASDMIVSTEVMQRAVSILTPLVTTSITTHLIGNAGHIPWNDDIDEFNQVFTQIIKQK